MSTSSILQRIMADPDLEEKKLLETRFDREYSDNKQTSFFNNLEGDLEARVIQVNKNTDQKVVVVTQDKVLLILKRNLAKLGRRSWIAPLSTLISLLTALVTANFKYALGLGPSEWKAIFIVSSFLAAGWLARSAHKAVQSKTFQEVVADTVHEMADQERYVREA